MKKIFSILIVLVLSVALFATPQSKIALLNETEISNSLEMKKILETFGTSKSIKVSPKVQPADVRMENDLSLFAGKKTPAEVISLTGEGFLVGPEFEAETNEWYVACEAQGYTFRLCWYGTAEDFTGSFDVSDIDLEDSWGWFESSDLFYEIYYADVTMTVSEKTQGNLKQIIIDATILDTQDRTYQLHVEHNMFEAKSVVNHRIDNGQLSFGLGQYKLDGNNKDLDVELVVNSDIVDGVFTRTDLDLNHTNVVYQGQTQQMLQTNLSVMPATLMGGQLGYDVDFSFYNQDTILHQVSMPTPLPEALDTIEVKCTNLEVDESLGELMGFVMLQADNEDYHILVLFEGTETKPGVYRNVAVTISDKLTWQPVESITATLTLTEEADGWHAHIETYAMDYNWYVIDMSFVVPTPTRTVEVTFDKTAMATYNPGDNHTIQLLAVGDEYEASVTTIGVLPGESFTFDEVMKEYSELYNRDAEMTIKIADITGKLTQSGDTTYIHASVIGFNAIQYDITLWYCVPVPVDTVEIEMPVKFTNALQDGYYTLSSYTPDSAWYVALSPITQAVAGTFVNDGVFGKFGAPDGRYDFFGGETFIYSSKDMANYPIEKGTMTVKEAADGSIYAEATVIARNAVCYHIKMTTEYNEHLDFDEPYSEIYRDYTTEDNVTIDDQTALNDYIYLALTAADGSDMAAFFFYVEESDEETIVPVGTYPIDYSEDYGTVQANPGVMGDGVWPSFYAELLEDGSIVVPLWLLVGGTVEVSKDDDGYMHLSVEAYNSYGVPVYIEYDGTPIDTEVESPLLPSKLSCSKRIQNGRLLIERNGKIFSVLGVQLK